MEEEEPPTSRGSPDSKPSGSLNVRIPMGRGSPSLDHPLPPQLCLGPDKESALFPLSWSMPSSRIGAVGEDMDFPIEQAPAGGSPLAPSTQGESNA